MRATPLTLVTRPTDPYRVGLIVPSSNITMEREIPILLRAREERHDDRFTVHASRVRLHNVTPAELAAMNLHAEDAAEALADAEVDVVLYACLVAVMAEGPGAHRRIEARIEAALAQAGCPAPAVTSAGALVDTLHDLGAGRVALVAPYAPALTERVCAYLGTEGIDVVEPISLSVTHNAAVGRLDPAGLTAIADTLPRDVDAVVLSACVQMPSLDVLAEVEERLGLPVISAGTASALQALRRLGLSPGLDGFGRVLGGTTSAGRKARA